MRIAVMAVVVLVGACSSGGDKPSGASPSDDAVAACQELVLERLRAPGSADFVGEPRVTKQDDREVFEVIGDVDSENGFGALVRSTYRCDLFHTEDGTYRPHIGTDVEVVTR